MPENKLEAVTPNPPNNIGGHTSGLLTRVVRGTAWSLLASFATALASFVVTPFTLRLFGPEQYGVWSILITIVTYFGFTDFGMTSASTKFASDAYSRGNAEEEASVIWTSLLAGLVPATVFAIGLAFFADNIAHALVHGTKLAGQATVALRVAGLIFIGYVVTGVLNTAELVRLRLGLFSIINTGAAILQITLVPIVLKMGGGLVGATAAVAAVTISAGIIHGLVSGWIFPGFWAGKIKMRLVRPLLMFGAPLVFSFFAEMALIASDKLVLAGVLGPRAVAHYAVAANFAALLAVIPQALSRAMLPAFGRFLAFSEKESLNTFYQRAFRGNILWLIPTMIAFWIICRPFLSWWAGVEYGAESTVPAHVLLVGCVFDALSISPARLLLAAGRPKTVAWIYAIQVLPFLACTFLMAQSYGVVGVAIAWSARALINFGLLSARSNEIAAGVESPFPGQHLQFLIAVAPLIAGLVLASHFHAGFFGRVGYIAVGLTFYALAVWHRILRDNERQWLTATVSGSIKL